MPPDNHPPPPTRSGDDAERQHQQQPPRSQARNSPGEILTNGDAYGPAPAATQTMSEPYASRPPAYHPSDHSPEHASGMATREVSSNFSGAPPASVSLPPIRYMVPGPPNGAAPPPAPFGPVPPMSYYPTTRPDSRVFADPARPALNGRAPPPSPLDIPTAQHIMTSHTGHHVSRPPSRGSYPPSAQLPPAQYPLPSASPRHPPPPPSLSHPPSLGNHDLPARYEHRGNPGPGYGNVAPGSALGHDRLERPVNRGFASWDYDENLERVKTYSHSISHFAESYMRAAREQNGGHPIQSRLPSEGEIKEMLDHAFIITNCLRDISHMVPVAYPSMETERVERPVEHEEQPMATYSHQQPPPMMHTTRQPLQPPPGNHALPPQMLPPQTTTHGERPPQQTYSLAEHKLNNAKRRGVSLESPPPSRGSAPRYTDPPRKRAVPPGRCHSCNRVDTPEWRRGPDGARTLCNACGLHYAKLERKKASELRNIRARPSNNHTGHEERRP